MFYLSKMIALNLYQVFDQATRKMSCKVPCSPGFFKCNTTNFLKAQTKFERILQILPNAKWHLAQECDEVFSKLKSFIVEAKQFHLDKFTNFEIDKQRLDEFCWTYWKGSKYTKLQNGFLIILHCLVSKRQLKGDFQSIANC